MPTTKNMKAVIKDIEYEFRMLCASLDFWMKSQQDRTLKTVAQESFLVHTRNLLEFLRNDKSPYSDDVLAAHYIVKGTWTRPRTPYLDKMKVDLNKRLSHLSYFRETSADWRLDLIAKDIDSLYASFWSELAKDAKGWEREFKKSVSEYV